MEHIEMIINSRTHDSVISSMLENKAKEMELSGSPLEASRIREIDSYLQILSDRIDRLPPEILKDLKTNVSRFRSLIDCIM